MSPSRRSTDRRRVLALSTVVVLSAAGIAACGGGGDSEGDADTIVVSTFPFNVEPFTEAVVDPFTEATGIEVEIETGSNADRLSQLQLDEGDSGIDVMLISDTYAAIAQEDDLFQQVTAEDVPALEEIAPFATEEGFTGPAYSYQLNGIMYDTETFSAEEAADWAIFGDEANAGRVVLPDIAVTSGQLTVSAIGEVYGAGPYDVDTAFSTLAEWSPNVLQFYGSSTEMTNLLTQGEIVAGAALNGFATDLVAAGENVGWTPPAEGRYMATNRAMVPSEAPNVEGAHQFIDYLLSLEAQQASAELVGDLPVNLEVEMPEELTAVVGDVADDPEAAGYSTLDPNEITPNRNEWVERFAREVVGG
ncbi:ABC transporter substrate-binding protein [Georgenia sp. Z1344]|uniref:ABC transporter substrate-binding protein n=1 Tax=Georgenia sp. Z1344 TaxID=3416706 RepID=UPI003CFA41FF